MQDFETDDIEVATTFYGGIADPTAKAILDFLIDHPEQRFGGAAIVQEVGLARHSDVARATFTLGEAAAALGRRRPWREAQLGYVMPVANADLLRRARDRVTSDEGRG